MKDQVAAGAFMWVFGSVVFLVAVTGIVMHLSSGETTQLGDFRRDRCSFDGRISGGVESPLHCLKGPQRGVQPETLASTKIQEHSSSTAPGRELLDVGYQKHVIDATSHR